tara:strand:- start:1526 stop:1954 length:429 start_codon:yes stop_codon:yes gene_type:complete
MSNRQHIFEVLEKTCELKDREDRIAYLKEHAFKQVKSVLQLCYNDKVVLDLPYGKPPFEECPIGREPTSVQNAFKAIGVCVKGNRVNRMEKEKKFIQILESINKEDALILCAAKDSTLTTLKNKKYSKITKSLVEACFPEIL